LPIGTVLLVVLAVLVYFGLAHRALDRMRLSDRAALLMIGLLLVGSWLNLTLVRQPVRLTVNVGGALVPLGIAAYLLAGADSNERVRSIGGAVVTAGAVYGLGKLMPAEPTQMAFVDPVYLFALAAGAIAYLVGRSRRAAFVAAVLGVVLADVVHYLELVRTRIPGHTWVGGAGAFDSVVIAGVLAVFLAEVVGEVRERATAQVGEESDGAAAEGEEVSRGET